MLNMLAKLARDESQPGMARVAAANAILDRAMGKPSQSVEVSGIDGGPVQIQSNIDAALQKLTYDDQISLGRLLAIASAPTIDAEEVRETDGGEEPG
jgi:hypothetical protein